MKNEDRKNRQGNTLEVKLDGWLDTQTSMILEEEIRQVDESVAAYKKVNGALTLKKVPDEIRTIIRMTGLDRKLTLIFEYIYQIIDSFLCYNNQ